MSTPAQAGRLPSKRFIDNESGNTLMVFAMMLVPMVAFIGAAVDYGRGYAASSTIQHALDAASLVGGREFDKTGSQQAAVSAATSYFNKIMPRNIKATLTSVTADAQGNIQMSAKASLNTTFLHLIGLKKINVSKKVDSIVNDHGGMDVELAIVMDVTGSMNDNNKLVTAKAAANDLLNILLPDSGNGQRSVRISMVPFSEMVNVGSAFASAATGQPASYQSTQTYWQQQWVYGCTSYNYNGSCRSYGYTQQWVQAERQVTNYLKTCTVERMAATGHAYDDATPGTAPFHSWYTTNQNNTDCGVPSATITPLTSNKQTLRDAIAALTPGGGTAGHIGTAWGWYTISTNWASFWPAGSQPAAANPQLFKAIIVMTDGDYNTHYDTSFNSVYEDSSNNPSVANGRSRTQAMSICGNIKLQGIEVFAVGVELSNQTARNTLLNCVSAPNHLFEQHYYDVANNLAAQTGLRAAFTDIATKIAAATGTGNMALRLTQ